MKQFLQHPEECFPEDNRIMDAIKWHLALMELIDRKRSELNPNLHRSGQPVPMGEIKISDEIRDLITRDRSFFSMMQYEEMALIEAAMMIGRELWYRKHHGFSDYDPELASTDLTDLDGWAEVFSIPLTEADGGNLTAAVDYTLSKRTDFLRSYVDAVEGSDDL